jgi:hypothetical protein
MPSNQEKSSETRSQESPEQSSQQPGEISSLKNELADAVRLIKKESETAYIALMFDDPWSLETSLLLIEGRVKDARETLTKIQGS